MPQYQSARSSTTRHTYLLVLCPVHIPPVHMPQSTYPSPHTPRPHIIITIYSTKLYQKISWVCCRLYCYECAAQVTMPTATNKWTLPHPHSQTLSDTPTVSFPDPQWHSHSLIPRLGNCHYQNPTIYVPASFPGLPSSGMQTHRESLVSFLTWAWCNRK